MLRLLAAMLVASASTAAHATVLTFDFGGSTMSPIPQDYGDRVITADDIANGYMYEMGNGFTPKVVVDYFPNSEFAFDLWETGYGDLDNVLGHTNFGVTGEIVLTPDPGFFVVLNSFDVAGWESQASWPDSRILILDADDNVLFDSGLIAILSTGHLHLSFPSGPSGAIVSATAVRILLFDFGDLGIDNINFDQAVIPIPAAAWMMLSGLGLLFSFGRRRITATATS